MKLEVLNTLGALRRIESEWNSLGPSPMLSPAWLVSWWEAFGEDDPACELATLAVRDAEGRLAGLAPWYLRSHPAFGPTLRLLGDGRASTDHHTILCRSPEDEPAVVTAAARWVAGEAGHAWRRIRFEALDADDRAMHHFERLLAEQGLDTERVAGCGSFLAPLCPDGEEPGWEAYLNSLSKNRRKKFRRWQRESFDTGRATVRVADSEALRREFWPLLVELHRQRRAAMGEPGVFDEPRFNRFHELASERLLAEGRLYFAVTDLEGRPAAIDYAPQDRPGEGASAVYAYQAGIADWAMDRGAGNLSLMALAQHAVATGHTRFDMMRGDEPYKASWGAKHRPTATLHVRPCDAAGTLERWAGTAYRAVRDYRQNAEPAVAADSGI